LSREKKNTLGLDKEHRIPASRKFVLPKKLDGSRMRFQSFAHIGKKFSNIFKRFLHGLVHLVRNSRFVPDLVLGIPFPERSLLRK
jgi:hypothetical protein